MDLSNYFSEDEITKMIKYLIGRGLDKNEIKYGFNQAFEFFNKIPENFNIYRIISLNDEKDFNKEKMGVHWNLNKRKLIDSYLFLDNKKYFLIKAIGKSKDIILPRCFELNAEYPNEGEILIEDNLKFISIEEIKYFEMP